MQAGLINAINDFEALREKFLKSQVASSYRRHYDKSCIEGMLERAKNIAFAGLDPSMEWGFLPEEKPFMYMLVKNITLENVLKQF